jgi:hypothetical protein
VLGIGCNLEVWGDMAYEIAMWTNEEGINFKSLFTIKFQWKHKFFWCVATKWHNAH